MTYYETHQQNPLQHQQWAGVGPQMGQVYGQPMGGLGLGLQAAYGQPYSQSGGQQFGQPNIGQFGGQQFGQPNIGQSGGYGGQQVGQPNIGAFGQAAGWGQPQRQLSPQDVGEVLRQLVPLLPQVLAQAQQPQAAIGYGALGQAQRMLTQQDVNEVVRQILPVVPQIVALLQGQTPLQAAAIHGGLGHQVGAGFGGQTPFGQFPTGQTFQQPFAQQGLPPFWSAFGGPQGSMQPQRQLTQQDVNEVVRQLVGIIPQVIGNLQAFGQQRMQ